MTRGRKKDMTIPPSRALTQQRDYRARKAQYLSELELRCRRLEEENERLKKELAWAQAGLLLPSSPTNPETAKVSAELMQQLAATTAALARFQQVAFDTPLRQPVARPSHLPSMVSTSLHRASFPSPAPSEPYPIPPDGRVRLPPIETLVEGASTMLLSSKVRSMLSPPSSSSQDTTNAHSERSPSPYSSSSSECCGGIMDCTNLVEPPDTAETERMANSQNFMSRTQNKESEIGSPLRPLLTR